MNAVNKSEVTTEEIADSRRVFLRNTTMATLSGAAIMLLSGTKLSAAEKMAMPEGNVKNDVAILNVALGLEHEGINAYTLGAKSGLLQKPVLELAVKFQDDHKVHRDLLINAITSMGGSPVTEKSLDEYAKALHAETLKTQEDVLKLALGLELGATNAYLGVIPSFKEGALAKVAGRIAADEVGHWNVLNKALGMPMPKAMAFGV